MRYFKVLLVFILAFLFVNSSAVTLFAQTPDSYRSPRSDFDAQVNDLCSQISGEMNATNGTKIAVVEFSDLDGRITDFGKFLSEELITRLFQQKKFKVVERQLLNKILREQKFELTGPVDGEAAKKLGNLLGVEAIITGTVTDMPSSVRVNARLISTQSGVIFGVASATITKDDSIRSLMRVTSPLSSRRGANANTGTVTKVNSFTFEIKRIYRARGGSVCCDVLITNLDSDVGLGVGDPYGQPETKLYASNGASYNLADIYMSEPNRWPQRLLSHRFLSNVPMLVTLRFENAADNLDAIDVLSLSVRGLSHDSKQRDVRINVPRY